MHEAVTRRLPAEARSVIEALDATHFSALVGAIVTELHIRGDRELQIVSRYVRVKHVKSR